MSTKSNGKTWKLDVAKQEAEEYIAYIKEYMGSGLGKMEVCGSIRRRVPEVHDIDILAVCPEQVGKIARFQTPGGIPVDVYYTNEESWGAFQLFLTGSAAYNVIMRAKAKAKGFKLSQYGLYERDTDKFVAGRTELEIYLVLQLGYLNPIDRSVKFGERR